MVLRGAVPGYKRLRLKLLAKEKLKDVVGLELASGSS
jgi:hypothetical protein